MPRNVNGDYSLPAGNPVTTGTAISSTWANSTLDDIGDALTDSLSRSGDGAMLAPLELTSGAVGAPALAFGAETTTGLYRIAAGRAGVAVLGALVAEFNATGFEITGNLEITGTATFADLAVTDDLVVTDDVSIGGDLTITGAAAAAALTASGALTAGSAVISGTIELGHATANTLSGSGGVLSVEGHPVTTTDQAQTISAAWNFTTAPQAASLELGHATDTTLTRIAAGRVAVEGVELGYRLIPQNAQNGNYTLVLGDSAKHIYKASGGAGETITIPANASVAYDIGTTVTFINQGGGDLTIAITSDTLTLSPGGTTGSVILGNNGVATAIKVTATAWIITGTNLTDAP